MLFEKLTTGLFWIFRARFAYLSVLRVSSALISAGLMQAVKDEILVIYNMKEEDVTTNMTRKKWNCDIGD